MADEELIKKRDLELARIKKLYGENTMKLCKRLFPTILLTDGLMLELLLTYFSNNARTLADDILINDNGDQELETGFRDFIELKAREKLQGVQFAPSTGKTPYELMAERGYELKECKTQEEILAYKRYYAPNEAICTFKEHRLKSNVVFFAVKNNAEEIQREEEPQRDDNYGTSVISIQFTIHGTCTVSIKNRYNHTVQNPDATFDNNLDNIIPGLARSFSELLAERGLEFDDGTDQSQKEKKPTSLEIPGYVRAYDGKYYKYNVNAFDSVYFCPGGVIIDGQETKRLEPEKEILMDGFILNLQNKTISLYGVGRDDYEDSFLDFFKDKTITNINVFKDKLTRKQKNYAND